MAPSFRVASIVMILVMFPKAIDCYTKGYPVPLHFLDTYVSGGAGTSCITLFLNHLYEGHSAVACQSRGSLEPNPYDLGFNDKVRSVSLGAGVDRVVLFQHSYWRGARLILGADTPWFGESFNDAVSSFEVIPRVRAGCATVFVDTHYRGWRRTVCNNEPFVGDGWNDAISSIVVSRGTYVRVFTHHGYQGRSVLVEHNEPNLGDYGMNGEISSMSFVSFEYIRE